MNVYDQPESFGLTPGCGVRRDGELFACAKSGATFTCGSCGIGTVKASIGEACLHCGAVVTYVDDGAFRLPPTDALFNRAARIRDRALPCLSAEVAYDGARWLAKHAGHVIAHNERGFKCLDCAASQLGDTVWLTAAAWNERSE